MLVVAGLNDAPDRPATINEQREDVLVEGRPSRMRGDCGVAAGIAQEGPTWPGGIADGCMLTFAVRRKVGDHAVLETTLDDMILVRGGLADAHIYVAAVDVDRRVAMAGPVMLGPMLQVLAADGEDLPFVNPIPRRLAAEYVPARR